MFIISQYLLHKSKLCNSDNISTYSIAVGLIIYSSIYLYFLYYNNDFLFIFNKFIIFIIGIDLLLSTFYHFNNENIQKLNNDNDDLNFEESCLIENNNKIQEYLSISDDELTEDFDEDFDEEIVQDNESENLEEEIVQDNESENLEEQIQDFPSEYLPTENIQDVPSEYLPTENIQDSEIKKLLQSIPINNNVSNNEIVVEQPKPKAKRQPRKKINKVTIDGP